MDYLMGLKGKDFVMVCSDTTAVQQIITIKHDEDKIVPIDENMMMALSGSPADRVQFSEFILANVKLYALRNETKLSTAAVANFTRGELATALRKVRLFSNMIFWFVLSFLIEKVTGTELGVDCAETISNKPSHRGL